MEGCFGKNCMNSKGRFIWEKQEKLDGKDSQTQIN
jgi:hypothetical protein